MFASLLEEAIDSWEGARHGAVAELRNIPADQYGYRPVPSRIRGSGSSSRRSMPESYAAVSTHDQPPLHAPDLVLVRQQVDELAGFQHGLGRL